ncbi:hypothetical protein BH23CHL2_BH23CHL2_26660 [soil metagenome]
MLERIFNRSPVLDPAGLDTGGDEQLVLLDEMLDSLGVEKMTELLENSLIELPETPMEDQIWIPVLAGHLMLSGKEGNEAVWKFVEDASTQALPLLLFPLVTSSQERTRVRRLLYRLLDDDEPGRVVAGVSGFELRRDRKAHNRILPLREHPSPIVRAQALSYYRTVLPTDSLSWLLEAKDDPAPEVPRAAASCVLHLTCVPVLEDVRRTFQRLRDHRSETPPGNTWTARSSSWTNCR